MNLDAEACRLIQECKTQEKQLEDTYEKAKTYIKHTYNAYKIKKFGTDIILIDSHYGKQIDKTFSPIELVIKKVNCVVIDYIIDKISKHIDFSDIIIYSIREFRGREDDLKISYYKKDLYKLTYNCGTEGAGYTSYHFLSENCLINVLNEIKTIVYSS